jgi:hypothetical protein
MGNEDGPGGDHNPLKRLRTSMRRRKRPFDPGVLGNLTILTFPYYRERGRVSIPEYPAPLENAEARVSAPGAEKRAFDPLSSLFTSCSGGSWAAALAMRYSRYDKALHESSFR